MTMISRTAMVLALVLVGCAADDEAPLEQSGPRAEPTVPAAQTPPVLLATFTPDQFHFYGWDETYPLAYDDSVLYDGQPTARIAWNGAPAGMMSGGGVAVDSDDVAGLTGKHVRMTAFVKTEACDLVDAFFTVNLANNTRAIWTLSSSNAKQLYGTHEFTAISLILDVPANVSSIAVGTRTSGRGISWTGSIVLEEVSADLPTSTFFSYNY
jgi:hypothetical protein